MKKAFCLILALALFLLAGCSSPTPETDDPGKQGNNDPENGNKEISWPLAEGIWICEDNGAYEFIWMSVYEGENCYTDGYLFSGVVTGGPISEVIETEENVYEFVVSVPAVAENEMDSGHDDYMFYVRCDTSKMAEGILSIAYNGDAARDFTYIAEDLEHVAYEDVYGN